ncbi:hypothetical protein IGJ41_002740 [Enterococcus sp. DIV1537a]|uniref:hypothetical protein n=1 Tax=Enterococcus sp. DIV1537a TaxID=2774733 RepID=UPI003F208F88
MSYERLVNELKKMVRTGQYKEAEILLEKSRDKLGSSYKHVNNMLEEDIRKSKGMNKCFWLNTINK